MPRFSLPYNPQPGFWEPHNASIHWCEEKYYVTPWIAEVVNAFTNIQFFYLGIKGYRSCLKYRHDKIFHIAFAGYLFVGTGSFVFHSILYKWAQLWDELGMIVTTCIMFHATWSFYLPPTGKTVSAFVSTMIALGISAWYWKHDDPIFHQQAYGILTGFVLIPAILLMELKLRSSTPDWLKNAMARTLSTESVAGAVAREAQAKKDRRNSDILKKMEGLVFYGMAVFGGGFALWGIDRNHCNTLTRTRHMTGLPWGMVFELHGWWHIMTGIGAYYYIVWGIWLRYILKDEHDKWELRWAGWPSMLWTMPEVVPVRAEANGRANGTKPAAPLKVQGSNGVVETKKEK